ncbi:MAG: nucleotidyltransferase domain-containing protein [Flavobacteriales bacterium]|nr:nucleotidyltransferase domain-containing protein [Flavobacteriales bacterium]
MCRRNRVAYIYAFGSSVREDFHADSDVDVLVDVKPMNDLEAGGALLDLWDGLERFFQRPVDLLTERSLRNPYLIAEVERTKKLVYDGAREEVLV